MTKQGSFKRAVRQQARASGQRYTEARAQMQPDGRGRAPTRRGTTMPLPVLLAHVLLDINRAFERAGAAAGEQPSLVVWANLLRVIPDGGISLTDLPPAARISRRAMKTWLKYGWVEVDASTPSAKVVKPTEMGRRARDRWGDLVATTEKRWSRRVRGTRALRAALEALVGRFDFELPHYPMTYGTSDPSAIGGGWVPARAGPPRVPAHGMDWVPVVRNGAESATGLPLSALLSQALMAFTIDYEEARFPMAVAAILSRAMASESVPLSSVPGVLGIDGSGKSGLERHGIVQVTGKGTAREATLTKVGQWICDNHSGAVMDVTRSWRERYGEDVVDRLMTSLAEVDSQLADDLPDHVLVRYANGTGFRDVSFTANT